MWTALLPGSVLGSNARYSHRLSRVNLLHRKALQFEGDARIRFAAEASHKLEECLSAFRYIIDDVTRSDRPERQLERIAERLDRDGFNGSLEKTFASVVIDLVSITNLDIMAYPGILEAEGRRLLGVASGIGLSRNQIHILIRELLKNENTEEKLQQIERLQLVPDVPVPQWFLKVLGLGLTVPLRIKDFNQLVFETSLHDFLPHYMGESVMNAWTAVKRDLSPDDFNQEDVLIVEEMWEVVNSAHDALMSIPVGFKNLDAELSIFVSAMADMSLLVNHPTNNVNQEELNQAIINKLRPIIPILEEVAREAFSEVSHTRSQLMQKIDFFLTTDES